MAPSRIIDSHIHLWPQHMSNEDGHSWMTPDNSLSKPHLLSHYNKAASDQIEGVVYVETDVRYSTPSPDLSTWAAGPLDELRFLRSVVEGEDGEKLLAIVAWAPMDQAPNVLEEWLAIAEKVAGEETRKRVRGFRFLLQGITDRERFEKLVFSDDFVENLKILGRKGFSFDVGIDQHSGGIWQLRAFAKTIALAHQDVPEDERVVFVLNHLCKPSFVMQDFDEWSEAVMSLARNKRTYMKLSGAFSELPHTQSIPDQIRPWTRHMFKVFGARRIIFGSDWPVCNVRGPKGEDSWVVWREVVGEVLEDEELGLDEEEKEMVWRGTAKEVYGIR